MVRPMELLSRLAGITALSLVVLIVDISVETCLGAPTVTVLENDALRLHLRVSEARVPYLAKCEWRAGNRTAFLQAGSALELADWLPPAVASRPTGAAGSPPTWRRQRGDVFSRALAQTRVGDLEVIWVVELMHDAPRVQLAVRLHNRGRDEIPIDWYPIWMARWAMTGSDPAVKYWEALTYQPHVERLTERSSVHLHSRGYSSDRKGTLPGKVPYWQIRSSEQITYFGLAWSGGWKADIERTPEGISLRTWLPPAETQLVLRPGEEIGGPAIQLMPVAGIDEPRARATWIQSGERLARQVHGGPPTAYPFVYNHWYSAGRNLSRNFLDHQIEALRPYGFDVFVLDDGWFEEVGNWIPARGKFQPGELEGVFSLLHEKRLKTGIWSCPWLVHAEGGDLPPEVDRPPFLRKYMRAYALDLAGYDFKSTLLEHIQNLKDQFDIDWWKYDQELFGERSRHGKMKNVVALQEALAAVRRQHPRLVIESCMSGGRMINLFTDGIAQTHWIRDGGGTGYRHARSNFQEALGAIDFLSPAKVERWTNRPDEVVQSAELLRCYCRSAMVGVWGVSADLYKLKPEQREIIREEAENYRKLNRYKSAALYQILYPTSNRDLAGVVYYGQEGKKAALLLFRWRGEGAFTRSVRLDRLHRDRRYRVTNADAPPDAPEKQTAYSGGDLAAQGLSVHFAARQLAALYFLQAE